MALNGAKVIRERKRKKVKGRKSTGPFIMVPREVLDAPEFGALSPQAVKLLFELARQFRGQNNGDFSAAWSQMKRRGWRSPSTLARAKRELTTSGFAIVTRQGGRHLCSLYAVTWEPIDDCNGKHDEQPTRVALKLWREPKSQDHGRTNLVPSSINASSET